MENDQHPVPVHTNPRTMENDQYQLDREQGLSPLERYGHEGSSSYFQGLPDERPYIRTYFDDLNTFEPDEPFQIQSDTAHQQVNSIIPERREEKKETKKSKKLKELYEQSEQWMKGTKKSKKKTKKWKKLKELY